MRLPIRVCGIAALVAILAGGLVSGPVAAKQRRSSCPKFRPVAPVTESERASEVPKLPITVVTDRATEDNPVVIEFDQEAAAWWYAYNQRGPVVDGNEYFNVQIDTRKRSVGLHARLEWPLLAEELDLYMYQGPSMVAWSEAFNQLPAEATGYSGGPGFEYIAGYPAHRCQGFTLEDNAMWASPQKAQLKLWLGPIEWQG